MTNSYTYIKTVQGSRSLPGRLGGRSKRVSIGSKRSEAKASISRLGALFLTSLLLAVGTIDAAPVVAVIALGVMAWSVEKIRREERNGRTV